MRMLNVVALIVVAALLYDNWPQLKTGAALAEQLRTSNLTVVGEQRIQAIDAAIRESEGK